MYHSRAHGKLLLIFLAVSVLGTGSSVLASCGDWLADHDTWSGFDRRELRKFRWLLGLEQRYGFSVPNGSVFQTSQPSAPKVPRPCAGGDCRQAPPPTIPPLPVVRANRSDHLCCVRMPEGVDRAEGLQRWDGATEFWYMGRRDEPPDPPPRAC